MTTRPTLAVIGASLAGAKTAEAARNDGYDGRIVLLGDEPSPPYERAPLSKAVGRARRPRARPAPPCSRESPRRGVPSAARRRRCRAPTTDLQIIGWTSVASASRRHITS